MNERVASGSMELLDVRAVEFSPTHCEASGASADWEHFVVQLSAWSQRPSHLDEDGALSPTEPAISAARQLVRRLREEERSLPTKMIEDGDGGVVLTKRSGATQEKLRVSKNGVVEYLLFEHSRLVLRQGLEMDAHSSCAAGS